MAERRGGRRNVLQDDRELIRRYRLDRAGIVFVTDLIRYTQTSPTQRRNESSLITTLRYLSMQRWWFGSVTTFCKRDHTNNYSTFSTSYCVAVRFVSTGHSHLAGSKNCIYEYSSFPLAHNENEPLIVCAKLPRLLLAPCCDTQPEFSF